MIFLQLGQAKLEDNPAFGLEEKLDSEYFKRFYFRGSPDQIDLRFEISENGIEFWMAGTAELPSWSSEYIFKHLPEIEKEIKDIFCNSIEVVKQGNKTTIRILDSDQKEIRNYKYYQGLEIPWFSRKKITVYKPIFKR